MSENSWTKCAELVEDPQDCGCVPQLVQRCYSKYEKAFLAYALIACNMNWEGSLTETRYGPKLKKMDWDSLFTKDGY